MLAWAVLRWLRPLPHPADFDFNSPGPYRVQRVVDGDTLLLANRVRVRLLGVDTPEITRSDRPPEPWGLAAADFTRRRIGDHLVTLRFDRERRDPYDRVLAYVYIGETCLNEELIRAGYSRAETRYPYSTRMKQRFVAAEAEARDAGRGMWSRPGRN